MSNWLVDKLIPSIMRSEVKKSSVPEGLWHKCPSCDAVLYRPELEKTLDTVVAGVLRDWVKPDGSFRSRRLKFGWDNVPMHRWAQSQMFRALSFHLREINTRL